MRNKLFRVIALATVLCTGIMLGSSDVKAATSTPTPGEVYDNPVSGKKEYCPEASEFTIDYRGDKANVTEFNIACTDEYDAVVLPGTFIKDGSNYTATYDGVTFRRISEKGKGAVVQNGAVVTALEDNLLIDYIRFDSGCSLEDYSHAFRGWSNLTKIEGFMDAIKPNNSGVIDLGNTFGECTSLNNISLDLKGRTVTMYKTFAGCNALKDVVIKNGKITRIEQMAVRGNDAYSATTGVNVVPMNVSFQDIMFPTSDSGSYLSGAFESITGTITFSGCESDSNDGINFDSAFASSVGIRVKQDLIADYNANVHGSSINYTGGNITVKGAEACSTNYMFRESAYGVIQLSGLITENTKSTTGMFLNADFVSVTGIGSWQFGETNASTMFKDATALYDTESNKSQTNYLEEEILHDLRTVDTSRIINANEMLCFDNTDYIADYRELNLSGAGTFQPVVGNKMFYTPAEHPAVYKLPYSTVYYQTEEDKNECGGYRLTKVAGSSSVVDGSLLEANSLMTGSASGIRVINILSGDADVYNVIYGHALGDYLKDEVRYYSDSGCITPAVLTTVVTEGSNTTIYTKDDGIIKDIDSGVEFDFGTTTGNITATIEGESSPIRLIDYEPKLTIKKETTPTDYVLSTAARGMANSQFYEVGIQVNYNGVPTDVKTISRSLSISIPVPNDFDNTDFVVLHWEKGLDKAPTVVNSDINGDNDTIEFYISSFSHVALLYNESDTETKEVTVKWVDDGNYRNRSGIKFDWTANYDGGLQDKGTFDYTTDAQDETVIPFDVNTMLSGQHLVDVGITYTIKNQISHKAEWDGETMTLTLTSDTADETENRVVTVDMTDVTDEDFRKFVTDARNLNLDVTVNYDDDSIKNVSVSKSLATNYKLYEIPYVLMTKQANGAEYTGVVYSINSPDGYEVNIDYAADRIVVTKQHDVFGDYIEYNVTAFMNDDNNKAGIRPDEVKVKAVAKFGDKEWTSNFSIICRKLGYQSYQITLSVPSTCNGVPRDSITFEPDPVPGYKVSLSKCENDRAWIDYDIEGATEPEVHNRNVQIKFMNDAPINRPDSVIIYIQDSKGGNKTDRVINTSTHLEQYDVEVQVPTDDDYVITRAVGFTNYDLTYNGMSIAAVYNPPVVPDKYVHNFAIDIKDGNNEDGSRPDEMTVTVDNGKGDVRTFKFDVKKGSRFTNSIKTATEDTYKITKIEGFPERYKISIQENNATIEYTPEKISKKVAVKFEGDGDNKDETRPTSIRVYVKNGDTQVASTTLDSGVNWTANVDVNKYREGVEAKYTIDCDDVKNYSKSVADDEITLKFTGTLTKEAQDAENAKKDEALEAEKKSGVNAALAIEKENDMSIESFDWIDYANKYPDLKRAYGYNKQKLYAHYIRYGIAEGRVATFTGKYSTVNEDILAAYFPDDYKYALIETGAEGAIITETTTETETIIDEETVSGNSVSDLDGDGIDFAEPVDEGESEDGVVVNEDGTTTEKMTSEDGTVTEITKDADGNIISTKQYKTGDARDVAAYLFILLGLAAFIGGCYIGFDTLYSKRSK